jgi:hypothetical protein
MSVSCVTTSERRAHGRCCSTLPRLIVGLVLALSCMGCGSGGIKDRILDVPPPNPLAEAKSLLTAYAGGQPLGSEGETFEDLVQRVAAVDAAKSGELQTFLQEVKKTGRPNAAKAKKLLASFE